VAAAQARIIRRSSQHLGQKRRDVARVIAVHMHEHRRENRIALDALIALLLTRS
jgi:hypothetical protein